MPRGKRIFLAHSSEDKARVRKLYKELKERGLDPWLDEEDLIPGQLWPLEIPKAIRECDYFIACLSERAIQREGYLQKEFRMALDAYAEKPPGSIYLFPLKFDDCDVPDIQLPELGAKLRDIHWLDYWKPNGLEILLKALAQEKADRVDPPEPTEAPAQNDPPQESVLSEEVEDGSSSPDIMPHWVLMVSVTSALVFIAALLVIAVLIADPTPFQIFVFRIMLALAAAAFGTTIPGFFKIQLPLPAKGMIHAGGAMGLFVLIYQVNPPELISPGSHPVFTQTLSGTIFNQNSDALSEVLVTLPKLGKQTVTTDQGFFSFEVNLEKGAMVGLTAQKNGFVSYHQDVIVGSRGLVVKLVSSPPEMAKTVLAVQSNVSGARVYLDDRYLGNTELSDVEIPPGRHQVRVEKEGYLSYTKEIELQEGARESLTASLELQPPENGTLAVQTQPGDATIRILNIVPRFRQGMALTPGDYHLEVSADGYDTYKKWINLTARENKHLDIRLGRAKPKETFTNSLGMTFIYLPMDTYMMGSPAGEDGRDDDETQHPVTLTQKYYLQNTEVTQGQWQAVMDKNPSYFEKCGENCPVENVSWKDVQAFIQKLNQRESKYRYCLPTEAEWEYAARSGTTTPFSFGNTLSRDQANYYGNYPLVGGPPKGIYRRTIPVASFAPNAWGLYDMHGNVWEWCQDWYGDYPKGSVSDPQGPPSGVPRVLRGGGWNNFAWFCRSASRHMDLPGLRLNNVGFRLVAHLFSRD